MHRIDNSERATSRAVRLAALGGVAGPAAFIGAWTVGAIVTSRRYSWIDDPISRLAAVGADSRPLMTAGFVCFGLALPAYAWALRHVVRGPAWLTAATAGIATLAVAAAPLGHSAALDTWHGVFAGIGYVTLAATPLLAARPLARRGHGLLAGLAVVAGALAAASLLLTTTDVPAGLFQRLGLTVADGWIVASAVAIAAGRLGLTRPGPDRTRSSRSTFGGGAGATRRRRFWVQNAARSDAQGALIAAAAR